MMESSPNYFCSKYLSVQQYEVLLDSNILLYTVDCRM